MAVTEPSKTLVRKALARGYAMMNMRESIESGIPLAAENFLMDAWYGLYHVLFPEDTDKFWYYPCPLASYIEHMCEDGIIGRDDIIFVSSNETPNDDMAEIRLKSGIWRVQTDGLPSIEGSDVRLGLRAYHRLYGNSVHGCIQIGPHFIEFLHQMDAWYDLIMEELRHYCLTAARLELVEEISRSTFEKVVEGIFRDSGYEYKANYFNENAVEIRIPLKCGRILKFCLPLEDLQEKAADLLNDVRSIDGTFSSYGNKLSLINKSTR